MPARAAEAARPPDAHENGLRLIHCLMAHEQMANAGLPAPAGEQAIAGGAGGGLDAAQWLRPLPDQAVMGNLAAM